jgi:ankyrin repeat protein
MADKVPPNAAAWLARARDFYGKKNWIGALSSARNALRQDARNLAAWHLGCDTLIAEDRQHDARRFARALKRFAVKAGDLREVSYADARIAEVDEYFANYHRRIGETDLTHFASRGKIDKVRELLEAGTNPNEKNRTNWTALHCLGMSGNPEIARLLVEHGADLEATDTLQETPLITACRFGNPKLIPVLLELGANVGHVSKEKHTALWYAISSMKDVTIVKMLIDAGADPNETYAYGDNPFLLSVSAQKAEVTNYLLPLTEDVARMNNHQVCAIRFAAGYNDTDLIEKLLARGVDADQANNYGHTPLMSAAENDAVAAARLLLAHGADPLRKTQYGDSALSIAERRESHEIYELLTGGKQLDRRRD